MSPLAVGDLAPAVPGLAFDDGPRALFFYKVTCPTCRLVAPTMHAFEDAFPGRVVGIGQDPQEDLERFAREHAMEIRSIEDAPPYPLSDAYEVVSVPTLFLVGSDARLIDAVGAWDRTGFNRVAARIAELTGARAVEVSTVRDGLPAFQPG
jgi:thiol-disulfide isomerase/thioredoxin